MSYDPYSDDFSGQSDREGRGRREPEYGGDRPRREAAPAAVKGKVLPPAVMVIIAGVLNLVAAAIFGFNSASVAMVSDADKQKANEDAKAVMKQMFPNLPAPTDEDLNKQHTQNMITQGVLAGLSVVMGLLALLGGVMMMRLRGYGMAWVGAVAALLSPACCCLVGAGGGIWSFIVLSQPDVKAAFR